MICHSFMGLVRRASPLMHAGGSVMTMSYEGARKAVDHGDIMGRVKDARIRAPEHRLVPIGDVAALSASDKASRMTGTVMHIDGGRHVRI